MHSTGEGISKEQGKECTREHTKLKVNKSKILTIVFFWVIEDKSKINAKFFSESHKRPCLQLAFHWET